MRSPMYPCPYLEPQAFGLWNGRQWQRRAGQVWLSPPMRRHADYSLDCATVCALELIALEASCSS